MVLQAELFPFVLDNGALLTKREYVAETVALTFEILTSLNITQCFNVVIASY
jgi:hypothetical protein